MAGGTLQLVPSDLVIAPPLPLGPEPCWFLPEPLSLAEGSKEQAGLVMPQA
jgi:hypothetical protein